MGAESLVLFTIIQSSAPCSLPKKPVSTLKTKHTAKPQTNQPPTGSSLISVQTWEEGSSIEKNSSAVEDLSRVRETLCSIASLKTQKEERKEMKIRGLISDYLTERSKTQGTKELEAIKQKKQCRGHREVPETEEMSVWTGAADRAPRMRKTWKSRPLFPVS